MAVRPNQTGRSYNPRGTRLKWSQMSRGARRAVLDYDPGARRTAMALETHYNKMKVVMSSLDKDGQPTLMINKRGKVVSVRRSKAGSRRWGESEAKIWLDICIRTKKAYEEDCPVPKFDSNFYRDCEQQFNDAISDRQAEADMMRNSDSEMSSCSESESETNLPYEESEGDVADLVSDGTGESESGTPWLRWDDESDSD